MITGLDHIVLVVADLDAAIVNYSALLAAQPSWTAKGEGSRTALFSVANTSLEIMAPDGPGALADLIEAEGEGLKSLAFAVSDIEAARRRLERAGLSPEPIMAGESVDAITGARRSWRRTRAARGATFGPRLFFLQHEARAAPEAGAGVLGLDHVVLRTANADRAMALYGAKLGLDLRLDRFVEGLNTRFVFLRCGDLILECVIDPGGGEADRLWGLSWRVANAEAARALLAGAGFEVSDVRAGHKPGTRVFSVRDKTCSVPTLMLEPPSETR